MLQGAGERAHRILHNPMTVIQGGFHKIRVAGAAVHIREDAKGRHDIDVLEFARLMLVALHPLDQVGEDIRLLAGAKIIRDGVDAHPLGTNPSR